MYIIYVIHTDVYYYIYVEVADVIGVLIYFADVLVIDNSRLSGARGYRGIIIL